MAETARAIEREEPYSPGAHLPPGRYEELIPRLQVLLADFAELEKLELTAVELEPLPSFGAAKTGGGGDD